MSNQFALLPTVYLTLYFVLNLAYSFGAKNWPIVDVTILAFGFLLRVLFGGAVINVALSNWLYLTVLTFSFYMGLGKRRGEYIKTIDGQTRAVLKRYNRDFLDKNMTICMGLTLVFYSLWAVDAATTMRVGNDYLVWTVPLVLVICMKYSLTIEGESDADPMEVLLSDKVLIALVLAYGLLMCGILYGAKLF